MQSDGLIGLGSRQFKVAVYLEHRPQLDVYLQLDDIYPLQAQALDYLLANTSNNWRKIINCYAKMCFALTPGLTESWQDLRDNQLLRDDSQFALLFSKPDFSRQDAIHVISGRTYAGKLNFAFELTWLTPQFAVNEEYKVIVSPYFDYRQLTNERLAQLASLIRQWSDFS